MRHVLHLGLSYACNMKCKHCFVDKRQDRLSVEDYYKLLDEAYDLGVFIIYYTYGEPLLSENLIPVMNYAKKKGFVQILMTNGFYIDNSMIGELIDGGINKVCVSLDHYIGELHDSNRGIVGAFDKALSAIDLLVSRGVPIGIATTINDANIDALEGILNIAREKKVNYVSILRQRDRNIVNLSNENFMKYINFFRKCILQNEFFVNFHDLSLIKIMNEMRTNGEIDSKKFERYYEMNCCHKNETICVAPDGEVNECNLYAISLGNVKSDNLKNILKERCKSENIICCSTFSGES